ncbi:MAG: universal stress protein [Pyrinomonadaceae bacterium]|nr:universal stress protein [Pyrinomonadaceae bacterium]
MKVLLATDGSEYSREAARKYSKLLFGFDGVDLTVITVIDNFTPMATEPFISPEEFLKTVEDEMRRRAEQDLIEIEGILKAENKDLNCEKEILIGSAKQAIVRYAEKIEADLIVVGSHGYGFWERALLGSVSNSVVHHAPCSVLVLKA